MHNREAEKVAVPTLVFLHGMGTGANAWQPQVDAFRDGYRVLAPFLPGYGPQPGPFSLDGAVEMVAALLHDEKVPVPAHVCGLSLGALIALELARRHPELVRSLVLSAGFVAIPDELQAAREASAEALRDFGPEVFSQQVIPSLVADVPEAYRAQALVDISGLTLEGVAELVAMKFDASEWVGELDLPVLVLCGERDEVNLPLSRELAERLPNGRFEVVPDAGHVANLDAPSDFTAAVRRFLAD